MEIQIFKYTVVCFFLTFFLKMFRYNVRYMSIIKQINMLALLCYFIYQIFIYSFKKKRRKLMFYKIILVFFYFNIWAFFFLGHSFFKPQSGL